jgi:hypothetical protein
LVDEGRQRAHREHNRGERPTLGSLWLIK